MDFVRRNEKKRKILTYVIVFDEIHDFLDCSRRFNIKIHLMIIECLCYNSIHITPKRIVHNISTLSLSQKIKKSKFWIFLSEKKKRFFTQCVLCCEVWVLWDEREKMCMCEYTGTYIWLMESLNHYHRSKIYLWYFDRERATHKK